MSAELLAQRRTDIMEEKYPLYIQTIPYLNHH